MAPMTMLRELAALQEAIQSLVAGNHSSVTIDGVTYQRNSLDALQRREETLMRRLSIANVRKRVTPDFS